MLDIFTITSIVNNYRKNKALTSFGLHHQLLSVHFVSSRDGRLWHNYTAQQNAVEKNPSVYFSLFDQFRCCEKKVLQHKTYNGWEDSE